METGWCWSERSISKCSRFSVEVDLRLNYIFGKLQKKT